TESPYVLEIDSRPDVSFPPSEPGRNLTQRKRIERKELHQKTEILLNIFIVYMKGLHESDFLTGY
ncbi:MAG: hypothetical protein AAB112_03390, partial [Thermodesulfobacteriota bacterium]